jgi:hypothetical protein
MSPTTRNEDARVHLYIARNQTFQGGACSPPPHPTRVSCTRPKVALSLYIWAWCDYLLFAACACCSVNCTINAKCVCGCCLCACVYLWLCVVYVRAGACVVRVTWLMPICTSTLKAMAPCLIFAGSSPPSPARTRTSSARPRQTWARSRPSRTRRRRSAPSALPQVTILLTSLMDFLLCHVGYARGHGPASVPHLSFQLR